MSENPALDMYKRFTDELTAIDELANVILKGHLVVENHLNDIMKAIFPASRARAEPARLRLESPNCASVRAGWR